jgi:hydantoinase/carbamoylase family amidase
VTPDIHDERFLSRLEQLGGVGRLAGPGGGVTRLAWTAELQQAVELVAGWGSRAGASTRLDGAGNLILEMAGPRSAGSPLVTGSHLDTVVGAGHLDGAYGVVAGVEVLTALSEAGYRPRHPMRVVAYANEEGVVAPPFTGSRAIVGRFDDVELAWGGPDGITLAERLGRAGCPPGGPGSASWTTGVAATVELHVEQGPVLDRAGTAIGVVTAITGQRRGRIIISGTANHAGTTPMTARNDALVAAAHLVLAVEGLASAGRAEVATVGRLEVEPDVANVVPGKVTMTFDVRAVDESRLSAAVAELGERAADVANLTGTSISMSELPPTRAVETDHRIQKLIAGVADELGLASMEMASGAGHDCAHLADLGPVAMIFVPSRGGISHNAAESTDSRDLLAGSRVLLQTLLRLDEELDA